MTDQQLTNLLETVAWQVREKDGWQTTSDSAVPRLVEEIRAARAEAQGLKALLRECKKDFIEKAGVPWVLALDAVKDLLQRIEAALSDQDSADSEQPAQ